MSDKHKHYLKAKAAYYQKNRVYFDRYRKSKKLNYFEKRLLEIRALYSKDKWAEAKEVADSITPTQDSFLRGEYFQIQGYMAYKFNHLKQSIDYNLEALDAYLEADFKKGIFNANYNLSIYYFYFGDVENSKKYITQAQERAYAIYERADVLKQLSYIYLREENYKLAVETIEKAFEFFEEMNTSEQAILLTAAAELYFRIGDFDKAKKHLTKVKANKNNNLISWAFIQLKFLEVYSQNKLLKRMPRTIEEDPLYQEQWLILELLQAGYLENAKTIWDKLAARNPHLYSGHFVFKNEWEENGPFGQCIKKLVHSKVEADEDILNKLKDGSKLKKLYLLLTDESIPQTKEDLIEKLWECPYDPDLNNNFYQLVNTLKYTYGVSINNRNAAYKAA